MRRALAVALLGALVFVGLLASVALAPTSSPGSVGAADLMALAALNSKEGPGDLTCGPVGPAGPGAHVAALAAGRAGWVGDDLVLAVAIAGAESGWRPGAVNRNANGSTDHGLWQVNSVHATILASGDWADPYDNAVMARRVWAQAGSWRPWVAFTSGAYVRHLSAAREAVRGGAAPSQPCSGDAPGGPDNLTPWTRAMRDDVSGRFPGLTVGCYRAAEDGGEHPRGRACDFMADPVTGDALAAYVLASAARLHVLYVIWEQHIWSPERGWRAMADRGSPTANHMDHVHVSVRP
jgi:hypothetical protein